MTSFKSAVSSIASAYSLFSACASTSAFNLRASETSSPPWRALSLESAAGRGPCFRLALVLRARRSIGLPWHDRPRLRSAWHDALERLNLRIHALPRAFAATVLSA